MLQGRSLFWQISDMMRWVGIMILSYSFKELSPVLCCLMTTEREHFNISSDLCCGK